MLIGGRQQLGQRALSPPAWGARSPVRGQRVRTQPSFAITSNDMVARKEHQTLAKDHEKLQTAHGTLQVAHDTLISAHETLAHDAARTAEEADYQRSRAERAEADAMAARERCTELEGKIAQVKLAWAESLEHLQRLCVQRQAAFADGLKDVTRLSRRGGIQPSQSPLKCEDRMVPLSPEPLVLPPVASLVLPPITPPNTLVEELTDVATGSPARAINETAANLDTPADPDANTDPDPDTDEEEVGRSRRSSRDPEWDAVWRTSLRSSSSRPSILQVGGRTCSIAAGGTAITGPPSHSTVTHGRSSCVSSHQWANETQSVVSMAGGGHSGDVVGQHSKSGSGQRRRKGSYLGI